MPSLLMPSLIIESTDSMIRTDCSTDQPSVVAVYIDALSEW